MADKKLKAIIETVYQGDGAKKAAADIGKVSKEADKSNKSIGGIGGAAAKAKAGLADFMKTQAGAALGFATLGGAALGVVNFLKSSVNDWVAYNEEIAGMGTATGSTTVDLSRLLQAADDFGVKIPSMTMALKLMAQNGIVPTISNFANLSDELRGISDASERAERMQAIFGRGWNEVARFALLGGDAIREATAAVNDNMVVTAESAQQAREWAVAIDNIGDAWTGFKNTLAQKIIPPATMLMNDLSGATEKELDKMVAEIMLTSDTWEEAVSRMEALAQGANLQFDFSDNRAEIHSFAYTFSELEKAEMEEAQQKQRNIELAQDYMDIAIVTNGALQSQEAEVTSTAEGFSLLNIQMQSSAQYADQAGQQFKESFQGARKHILSAAEAAENLSNKLRNVPTAIGDQILADLKALDFKEAGAGFVEDLRIQIMGNLDKGLITKETAEKALGALFIAFEDVKIRAGEVSKIEAWNNVKANLEEWGMSADEAKKIFDELAKFDGSQIDMTALVHLIGLVQGMGGGGGYNKPSGDDPQLNAKGADYIVPAGYPNDSYPVGYAQSGERVTITPAGQTTNQGASISLGPIYITETTNARDTAEQVIAIVNRRMAGARNAGARYTGV